MPGLDGRVALVTGGARGLGAAVCESLAEAGALVVVTDVAEPLARAEAARIEAVGGRAVAAHMDVRDERQVASTIGDVVSKFGRLDVLVNNAGVDLTVPISELP